MREKSTLHTVIIYLICLGYTLFGASAKAQDQTTTWSAPVQVFEAEGEDIHEPVVVVDRTGVAHVLWRVGHEMLYHARLDQTGWSTPVDVVAGANVASAVVDERGVLHVIWVGPNHTLMYATALAAEAHSARAWSFPTVLEAAFQRPQIAVGNDDDLHIAFASAGAEAVKHMFSQDGGATWSSSSLVAQSSQPEAGVGDTRLAVGTDGALHVVWTEYRLPEGWPPLGVYYSRSTDGGLTWAPPMAIAGEGYDQITVAVAGDDEVHVAWNGMAGVRGRYHRWSNDGGETWSGINVVSDRGGTEGFPNLVVDSAGTVHMLTTFDHCAQYSRWDDGRWTQPVCISGPEAMASNYIEEAAMALGEGNRLHAVFWDGRQRLWYTTRQVEAPAVAPQPWPQPSVDEMVAATPSPSPEPTAQPPTPALAPLDMDSPRVQSNSLAPVLVGIVPAALLIAGVVMVWTARRSGRRK